MEKRPRSEVLVLFSLSEMIPKAWTKIRNELVKENPTFYDPFFLQALFGSLPPEFPDASKTHLCKGRSISLTLPSRN